MNKKIINNIFILIVMYLFMMPNYAMAISGGDYKIWTNSYEKEVLVTKEWKIRFNQEVKRTSEFENQIFITEQNSDVKFPVSLEFLKDQKTVIVKHNVPFEYGKQYYLYVNSSMESQEDDIKLKNGIKVPFKTKTQSDKLKNIGNTNGNISNGGNAVQNGEWIYYSGADNNGLYKIKTNNTNKTKLVDGRIHYINTEKDWIYFVDGDGLTQYRYGINSYIYKMRNDGSNKTKLCECDENSNLIVSNGWIYFLAPIEESESILERGLYKMKVDGTEKTLIAKDNIKNMNIVDDYIYYNDNGIYKIKIDGSNKTKLSNINPTFMVVEGNHIYYQVETKQYSEYKICCMDLNGRNIKEICNFKSCMTELFDANFFNVDNEWIYYVCKNKSELTLCKVKKDGTKFTKLADESCNYISITKDWIYLKSTLYADGDYDSPTFEMKNYKIKKDGTEKQVMESCIVED